MATKTQQVNISPHTMRFFWEMRIKSTPRQKELSLDLVKFLNGGELKTRKALFEVFRNYHFPNSPMIAHQHFTHCFWFAVQMQWIEEIGDTIIQTEKGRTILFLTDH